MAWKLATTLVLLPLLVACAPPPVTPASAPLDTTSGGLISNTCSPDPGYDLGTPGLGAYAGVPLPKGWLQLYLTEAQVTAAVQGRTDVSFRCNYALAIATASQLTAKASPGPTPSCVPPTQSPDTAPATLGAYAGLQLPNGWAKLYPTETAVTTQISYLELPAPGNGFIRCNYPDAFKAWQKLTGR